MTKSAMSMKKPSASKAKQTQTQVQPQTTTHNKLADKPVVAETIPAHKATKRITFTVTEDQHRLLKGYCSNNALSVREFMIELLEKEVFRGR